MSLINVEKLVLTIHHKAQSQGDSKNFNFEFKLFFPLSLSKSRASTQKHEK